MLVMSVTGEDAMEPGFAASEIFAVIYAWLLLGQLPSPKEFTGG